MNIEPFIFLGFQKFFQQRDIPMYITCLDLEGVLVPEIWIAFSEVSGIPELRRTTRDEPDYDKLMRWRMDILREHGLGLKQIQDVIAQIDPLPGAKDFLDELRAQTQAIIVSDTFEEFAQPLMKKARLADDLLQFARGRQGRDALRHQNALRAFQAYDRPGAAVHGI